MAPQRVQVVEQSPNGSKPVDIKQSEKKRIRRQRNFPVYTLEDALSIARSIAENNARKPYSKLSLAESIGRSPDSSRFESLLTSSEAYGLTEGGSTATQIKLSRLGLSIIAPTSDEEKCQALIKAVQNIDLYAKLLRHFDQAKIPPLEHFKNTLIRDFGVDASLAEECVSQFKTNGKYVGLIRFIAGADRVSIHDANGSDLSVAGDSPEMTIESTPPLPGSSDKSNSLSTQDNEHNPVQPVTRSRVFVTHGSNKAIVEQLKELLTYGKFIPIVAEEHETPSKPVPDKVLEDMRSCFAGIIHVASEEEFSDSAGNILHRINENVLIEIGVAMALYGKNFILLVQKGIHLPSNLQGLYRCEYEGNKLDYEATMKLLKAFNEFKP